MCTEVSLLQNAMVDAVRDTKMSQLWPLAPQMFIFYGRNGLNMRIHLTDIFHAFQCSRPCAQLVYKSYKGAKIH